MADPRGCNVEAIEFFPLPGQSDSELADLVERAKQMFSAATIIPTGESRPTPIRWRYLIAEADRNRVRRSTEIANQECGDPGVQAEWFRWQRLPGQTQAELDELVAAWRAALGKSKTAAGVPRSLTENLKGATVSEISVRQSLLQL
jgi:hypothetical protein